MGESDQRAWTLPAVLALSAGLGLTAATPAAATAAPPVPVALAASAGLAVSGASAFVGSVGAFEAGRLAPGPVAPGPVAPGPEPDLVSGHAPGPAEPGSPDRQKALRKALVTAKDLPKGFQEQDDSYLAEKFRVLLGERRPDADPCAVPADVEDPVARPPAEPVKAGEPVQAGEPARGGPSSAATLFLNEKKGMVVVETLAVTGAEVAADMVADLTTVLTKCPTVKAEGAELAMRPLDWDPPLGDRSRTVGMTMDLTVDGVTMTMHAKMTQVAYRDVSLAVGLIGVAEPADRHLKKVTNAAVRRLVTAPDLFSEPRDPRNH